MAELITYYVIASLLFVGAPAIFFLIVFMPALQNTKGRMVGYKDHRDYGDSCVPSTIVACDKVPRCSLFWDPNCGSV